MNKALVEVHAPHGLEKRVSEKTRAIFLETQSDSLPYSSREFQQANKVLLERVRMRIENEPEMFLQDAISQIRK